MTQVAVVGSRRSLDDALAALHAARCVELVHASSVVGAPGDPPPADSERDRRAGTLRALAARLEGLLELTTCSPVPPAAGPARPVGEAGLSDEDRRVLGFVSAFERRLIDQGAHRRTIEQTLDLAWELMSDFPPDELRRLDADLVARRNPESKA